MLFNGGLDTTAMAPGNVKAVWGEGGSLPVIWQGRRLRPKREGGGGGCSGDDSNSYCGSRQGGVAGVDDSAPSGQEDKAEIGQR